MKELWPIHDQLTILPLLGISGISGLVCNSTFKKKKKLVKGEQESCGKWSFIS